MNLDLSEESVRKRKLNTKSKDGSLSYGLNPRTTHKVSKKNKSVLDDDDDSDDNDSSDHTHTHGRNSGLVAEQNALRKRTQALEASVASSSNPNMYDYDAEYDAFSSHKKVQDQEQQRRQGQNQNQNQNHPEKKQSRYINNILKNAQEREREREIIYERKVLREQKAEEENEDFKGKEKFMTSAYRKKMEERQQWERREKMREIEEQVNDVTKRGSSAMASFYGNFNRNVAVRGAAGHNDDGDDGYDESKLNQDSLQEKSHGSKAEYEKNTQTYSNSESRRYTTHEESKSNETKNDANNLELEERKKALALAMARSKRAEKLAAARERYLLRQSYKQ